MSTVFHILPSIRSRLPSTYAYHHFSFPFFHLFPNLRPTCLPLPVSHVPLLFICPVSTCSLPLTSTATFLSNTLRQTVSPHVHFPHSVHSSYPHYTTFQPSPTPLILSYTPFRFTFPPLPQHLNPMTHPPPVFPFQFSYPTIYIFYLYSFRDPRARP